MNQSENPHRTVVAVLFDFDGTLVHSPIDFDAMRRGVRAAASAHGVDTDELVPRDVLGLVETARARIVEPAARAAFDRDAARAIEDEELRAAAEAVPAPDAVNVLRALRAARTAIAIVTRNSRPIVLEMAARFGLEHDVLVAREDTPRPKPAPIHLRRALVALGVSPRRAVFVGDHAMDALGAARAGMRSFGVPTPGRPTAGPGSPFAARAPDVMLEGLGELAARLAPSKIAGE